MAKKTSGIYKITNDRTGETYIGQSKNIERRKRSHENELRQGTHHNRGMQSDYLRGDTFSFKVLEETSSNRQVLNQKEEQYISQYNSFNQGYNQTPGGQYDKYQGYYGHGGGRLGSSTQQTSSYKRNNNYSKNYGNNVNYSSGGDGEVIKCALFVGLILFGPLIFMNILLNTQYRNFVDDSINYYAFIPLILFIIIAILILLYIFSDSIFSNNKTNNSKKKRKTSKKVKNDQRKFESENIYERKIESVKKDSKDWKTCPNCKKTIRKNNLICPRCGKFIGNNNSSNSKNDEMD